MRVQYSRKVHRRTSGQSPRLFLSRWVLTAWVPVPGTGDIFDIAADVFRHEPSPDIDRFQSFRMREYVAIGTGEQVSRFRQRWMKTAQGIADSLQLPYVVEQASDPFFGRTGQMKAVAQLQAALKFELLIPVRSP